MSNKKPTAKEIAKKYRVSARTGRNWRKNGIPINVLKLYENVASFATMQSKANPLVGNKNAESLYKINLEFLQYLYRKHQREAPLKVLASVMKENGERDYSLSAVSRKINGSLPMKDFEMQRLKDFYKKEFNEEFLEC